MCGSPKAEGFRAGGRTATNIEQVERILKENGVASRLERMISASTFKRSKAGSGGLPLYGGADGPAAGGVPCD